MPVLRERHAPASAASLSSSACKTARRPGREHEDRQKASASEEALISFSPTFGMPNVNKTQGL